MKHVHSSGYQTDRVYLLILQDLYGKNVVGGGEGGGENFSSAKIFCKLFLQYNNATSNIKASTNKNKKKGKAPMEFSSGHNYLYLSWEVRCHFELDTMKPDTYWAIPSQ